METTQAPPEQETEQQAAEKAEAQQAPVRRPPAQSTFREYLTVALWGLPIFLFATHFVLQNFKIPTQSMENTLLIGDHLTVNKFIYGNSSSALFPTRTPKRGDVAVFKWPGDARQFWVKRVIGLPGDKLELVRDNVMLGQEKLNEAYAFYKDPAEPPGRDPEIAWRPADYYTLKGGLDNSVRRKGEYLTMKEMISNTRTTLGRFYAGRAPKEFRRVVDRLESGDGVHIPPGFYFMMGDNRNLSWDSREWGFVPEELLEGRAYWVWWSYGEDENTHNLKGAELMKVYLRYPIEFFRRTHWEESMRRIK